MGSLDIGPDTPEADAVAATRAWVDEHVPVTWREAADRGGAAAIREVRSRADYEAWYPTFGASGLVAGTWPVAYGGLDLSRSVARAVEAVLAPYNLGRLNPLGLNLAAPALFAHGTEEQRLRFLAPIVRNEERWCQLFSEPGAGSDLASLATRADRDGAVWVVTGQKVWTTWAHVSDFGVLLARTDPGAPKRKGITYFLVDLRQPGVEVHPLRHIGGEIDFNEVFLDGARVPDAHRVGEVGDGWRVANATLSGERQMVSGSGSGGVDRIGGAGAERLVRLAAEHGATPIQRQAIAGVWSEERIRAWTNERVRAGVRRRALSRPRELHRQGPPGRAQPAHPAPGHRPPRRRRDGLAAPAVKRARRRGLGELAALRSEGDAAQPGEHHRGRHHRGQQEHRGGAGPRPAPGAGPLARVGVERRPPVRPMSPRYSAYETLLVERRGPVGWLAFDRPEVGNAMNATMLGELEVAWRELDTDPEVRVIVNTGNGPAFQTGLDVAQLSRDKEALREQSRRTRDSTLKLTAWHNQVWKPVIAAVNGTCAGGGLHFVADADIVIAAESATFLDPHVSIGQVTAFEAIALARTSPMEAVLRMALVGRYERITAERARVLGILSEVVADDDLEAAALDLAEKVARNSPAAMAATKRALWGALERGLTDACRAGAAEMMTMWGHPDQTEGPVAWAEKREPQWELS